MRRKPTIGVKREPSRGKPRRSSLKIYAKKVSSKFRSHGPFVYRDGSHIERESAKTNLLDWITPAETVRRDSRTGRFITYRSDEAIERTSKRFAGALKRLADK